MASSMDVVVLSFGELREAHSLDSSQVDVLSHVSTVTSYVLVFSLPSWVSGYGCGFVDS